MKHSVKLLNKLIRLNKNSEEGFRVAAESVQNRGLKALLKAYAQQRHQFRTELEEMVLHLNGRPYDRSSKIGGLHRGWIVIKGSLTIGSNNVEHVVLTECRRGERYALNVYQSLLHTSLSPELLEIINRQYESLRESATTVIELNGDKDYQVVVRLFNNDADASEAVVALHQAGFDDDHIRTLMFNQQTTIYADKAEKKKTMIETSMAGGVGGAMFGTMLGLFSSIGLLLIPAVAIAPPMQLIALITLFGLLIGCAIGVFFGFLIGISTFEQDSYLYKKSTEQGQVLMMVDSETEKAQMATEIMRQVNIDHAYRPA